MIKLAALLCTLMTFTLLGCVPLEDDRGGLVLGPPPESLQLAVGDVWKYGWNRHREITGSVASPELRQSGTIRVELVEARPADTHFGRLIFYRAEYAETGDATKILPRYEYFAAGAGVVYTAEVIADGSLEARVLYDANDMSVQPGGYMKDRLFLEQDVSVVPDAQVDNPFIRAPAIALEARVFEETCSAKGCTSERERVREYYLPGIGLAGYHRVSEEIYAGGNGARETWHLGLLWSTVGKGFPR